MLENCFNDLDRLVTGVTTRYYRGIGISREDVYQELWLCLVEKGIYDLVEKDPKNMALANKVLNDKAIDMYRRTHSKFHSKYSEPYLCFTNSFEDADERYVFTESAELVEDVSEMDMSEYLMESLLSAKVGDREHDYIVIRFYLSAGIENLYPEFSKIVDKLTDDQKILLFNAKSDAQREECIAKFIFGYAGRNVPSYRNIRFRVRDLYKSFI